MNIPSIRNKKIGFVCLSLFLMLVLPGCWDEVNLQDVSYISALGIDYKEGQYEIYAQMLNFSAIAKTDTPQTGQANQVWIGKAKAESIIMAYQKLSRGGYLALNLDHLKTIIVHERVLGRLNEILDGVNRQRASRYTTLMYGTRLPLDELFNTENFFSQSPLNSIMYMPRPHEKDYTFAKAQTMQSLVQQLKEPAETSLLPALDATQSYWKHGKKTMNTQLISGVFVLNDYLYKGYAPEDRVKGIRWINEDFQRVVLMAEKDGNRATVAIVRSRPKIRATIGETPRFELTVKLMGSIVELEGEMIKDEIKAIIEKNVREEIEAAYRYGAGNSMDLFGLEHALYRYHNGYWKQHVKDKNWKIEPDQLNVKVIMNVADSGKFELNGRDS
ncbi:Ger(x)C family spore germination protein [Paenibacillus soyae]|uniref:Ger(X)C family spore germination protein n=1 Tax=Paenibacillus soyae TaxID=2969249 RepID=A0A9X2MLT7_9BACL|nr:Ger(x)C family spore germination protein [Paenibacillus soyae]MCR2802469.1 Ger(x)C family spore germination protein [Paenibacillus soyae]